MLSKAAANRSFSAFSSSALDPVELMYRSCSSSVCWLVEPPLFPFWPTFGLKNSSVSKLMLVLELSALCAFFTELYIQCFSLSNLFVFCFSAVREATPMAALLFFLDNSGPLEFRAGYWF